MKITIAYLPDFEPLARAIAATIRFMVPGIKVKFLDRHKPYKHIYLRTTKTERNLD